MSQKIIQLDIQSKYFEAILSLQKPFEISHKKFKQGSIIKLNEITICKDLERSKNCNLLTQGSCAGCPLSNVDYEQSDGALDPANNHTGRYILFKSGKCETINELDSATYDHGKFTKSFNTPADQTKIIFNGIEYNNSTWYDEFCWQYISKKQSYIVPIAKILAVGEVDSLGNEIKQG